MGCCYSEFEEHYQHCLRGTATDKYYLGGDKMTVYTDHCRISYRPLYQVYRYFEADIIIDLNPNTHGNFQVIWDNNKIVAIKNNFLDFRCSISAERYFTCRNNCYFPAPPQTVGNVTMVSFRLTDHSFCLQGEMSAISAGITSFTNGKVEISLDVPCQAVFERWLLQEDVKSRTVEISNKDYFIRMKLGIRENIPPVTSYSANSPDRFDFMFYEIKQFYLTSPHFTGTKGEYANGKRIFKSKNFTFQHDMDLGDYLKLPK